MFGRHIEVRNNAIWQFARARYEIAQRCKRLFPSACNEDFDLFLLESFKNFYSINVEVLHHEHD